jgi:hypothetical protein
VDAQQGIVLGSHVYADDGNYSVVVCVSDGYAFPGCAPTLVTVLNVPPFVEAGPELVGRVGEPVVLAGSFVDLGTLDNHVATIEWGDGSPPEGGIVAELPFGPPGSPAGMTGTVHGVHIYTAPGPYVVTLTVTDDEGAPATDPVPVAILPPP